ncbi:MAG: aminotransferase class IV, partial [Pseudomonadota bacterium]
MQDGAEGTIGAGAHAFADDPRNAEAAISVNGRITPRAEAMVSVFDSGFVLGDGVWEGLRLRAGRIGFLRRHFTRLYEGARTLDFEIGLGPDALARRIWDVLDANGMRDGVHIRLMVTRGLKATPYQDPRVTFSPATVVIAPVWKRPTGSASARDGAAAPPR